MVRDPWLETVDWEGMLRRECPAPWVPPANGSALTAIDFEGPEAPSMAMAPAKDDPYDSKTFEPMLKRFGPYRTTPWPQVWEVLGYEY